MTQTLLEVKGLKTEFKRDGSSVLAVAGVDFHINKGEVLGLVGESGCGKSVTSLSIMRLLKDTPGRIAGGSVLFEGKDLVQLPEKDMRRYRGNELAMIFQEPMTSLNPVLRIGKQLEESIMLHLGYGRKKAREHAIESLKLVGIPRADEVVDDYPHQLSGGMRQRVMIAMAMACNPKLLIADEPTTALDVTIQAQILELMNRLKKEQNMGMLLITHDLGVVAEMCDRVVVMYAGRVVEEASVTELFENPQHPYTKGLIASVPKLRQKVRRLESIPGNVPDLRNMPPGCKFAPRCPYVMERCLSQEPQLLPVANEADRKSRCWLTQDGHAKGGETA
ncbi:MULTISPECIES: ABC transporter ATP-binding protein [Paenibacillus]|uniref:Peptide ABC transporter ATP-binding protein n=1 Tax=Paenibacillus ihbetae TaxID=1870820 RepID=A0A1B2E6Y5_9BACL|nr:MULTISPECIES: ABC transporter ATP-binding protein [Paenibacillus]ANY75734.1 peptide ABC transporter ATP-binding protein [Paenibacillus ihbetae]MCM3496270.1 ABC transporter ATP-binding protein [Paenibacillus lactis]OOC62095.1 peptide ABC transporter ATP-binding protein [Paenibacillus ihbetae]GIO94675.1 ABC transporter ATP-binding protein [Paenibacillus lactis]